MSTKRVQTIIENAIQKADSSYFFENYTKQAAAVIKALEAAGYTIAQKDMAEDIWLRASNEIRTGRLRPEEHIKDVYQTVLRLASPK
jgi:hypothetical protein